MKRASVVDRAIDDDLLTDRDTEFWHVRPLSAALASTTGEVATLVRRILRAEPSAGFRAWQELAR